MGDRYDDHDGYTPENEVNLSSDGQWRCLLCSNWNFSVRKVCNMRKCQAPRGTLPGSGFVPEENPRPKQVANIAEGEWVCKVCTNVNYKHRTNCNMRTCGAPRDDWVCLLCGNVNFAQRTHCNIKRCQAPRPPPVMSMHENFAGNPTTDHQQFEDHGMTHSGRRLSQSQPRNGGRMMEGGMPRTAAASIQQLLGIDPSQLNHLQAQLHQSQGSQQSSPSSNNGNPSPDGLSERLHAPVQKHSYARTLVRQSTSSVPPSPCSNYDGVNTPRSSNYDSLTPQSQVNNFFPGAEHGEADTLLTEQMQRVALDKRGSGRQRENSGTSHGSHHSTHVSVSSKDAEWETDGGCDPSPSHDNIGEYEDSRLRPHDLPQGSGSSGAYHRDAAAGSAMPHGNGLNPLFRPHSQRVPMAESSPIDYYDEPRSDVNDAYNQGLPQRPNHQYRGRNDFADLNALPQQPIENVHNARMPGGPGGLQNANRRGNGWVCPVCSNLNFAARVKCNMRSCGAPKPSLYTPEQVRALQVLQGSAGKPGNHSAQHGGFSEPPLPRGNAHHNGGAPPRRFSGSVKELERYYEDPLLANIFQPLQGQRNLHLQPPSPQKAMQPQMQQQYQLQQQQRQALIRHQQAMYEQQQAEQRESVRRDPRLQYDESLRYAMGSQPKGSAPRHPAPPSFDNQGDYGYPPQQQQQRSAQRNPYADPYADPRDNQFVRQPMGRGQSPPYYEDQQYMAPDDDQRVFQQSQGVGRGQSRQIEQMQDQQLQQMQQKMQEQMFEQQQMQSEGRYYLNQDGQHQGRQAFFADTRDSRSNSQSRDNFTQEDAGEIDTAASSPSPLPTRGSQSAARAALQTEVSTDSAAQQEPGEPNH